MRKDARPQKAKPASVASVSATSNNPSNGTSESEERKNIEKARQADIHMTNMLCILLIIGPTIASAVIFCITRNPASLSLAFIIPPAIIKLRHRLQMHLYPFSQEELQIELKDREVEIERIKKQSGLSNLTILNWLRHLFIK